MEQMTVQVSNITNKPTHGQSSSIPRIKGNIEIVVGTQSELIYSCNNHKEY
uniref:Uncharacterized protein n=1 Tax=Arundo donax TaxID=35708 RepID=A0A0A9H6L5_ARUDO